MRFNYSSFKEHILGKPKIKKVTRQTNVVVQYRKTLRNPTIKPKEIVEEFQALLKMSDQVIYNSRHQILSIMTTNMAFDDDNIGSLAFVVVNLSRQLTKNSIKVFFTNQDFYHPHIDCDSGGVICFGEAYLAVKRLCEGRITDFFTIMEQMIKTG